MDKNSSRVHKVDRELFPAAHFGWNKSQYKDELDKQVELKRLDKQLAKERNKLLERVLLEEDRRYANLNKSIRDGNMKNLMKSFYKKVRAIVT